MHYHDVKRALHRMEDSLRNMVREMRGQRGITQEELAEKVGVSRQTIISIESGRYNPSIILAYKLASTFRLRIEDIFLCAEEINMEDRHE
jgi:putative transcriptional regulator